MDKSNQIEIAADIIAGYSTDCELFAREVFGFVPTPQQRLILQAISKPNAKVVVKSGHGVGKSATAAIIGLWHLFCFPESKTAVTAPSSAQLNDVYMQEIKKWWQIADDWVKGKIEPQTMKVINLETNSFISARTADASKPDALQGFHSDSMMFIVDEAFGVAETVYQVAMGALTSEGSRVLLIGNPTDPGGFPAKCIYNDRWQSFTLSCIDSPLVSPTYIQDMKNEYGEDSDVYKIRVLGELPSASVSQFIPNDLVEESCKRYYRESDYDYAPKIISVDVAAFGDDKSVICMRQGLFAQILWEGQVNTMRLAEMVISFYTTNDADMIMVDATGIGLGTCDRLKQLGYSPLPVMAGGKSMKVECKNKRMEMWFLMKQWLQEGGQIPDHKRLKQDLVQPLYFFTPTGEMQLESKQDMKREGKPSTDFADALALTFAYPAYKRIKTDIEYLKDKINDQSNVITDFDPLTIFSKH